jgi:hypothetical protein
MLNQWLMRLQEMFFEQQGLNYFWFNFVVLLLLLSSLLLHRLKIINNKLKSGSLVHSEGHDHEFVPFCWLVSCQAVCNLLDQLDL